MKTVFTDGACAGNPGPGGWGWALCADSETAGTSSSGSSSFSSSVAAHGSGSEAQSTNQRMEVWAVLDALTTLLAHFNDDVTVVSDSTYVVNCFRDSWWRGWEARGWKNSQKQPVANQDLWKPLIALYKENSARISFRWVKGHSGNEMNDIVDTLAVAAGAAQSPRTVVGLDDPPANASKATSSTHVDTALLSQAVTSSSDVVGFDTSNDNIPLTLF
jgi:ribonuclease HI